jgi:hypothetical protein
LGYFRSYLLSHLMKQITFFLFFIISLTTGKLFAQQKQGAWWYFGEKAGLNFNTEPPVPNHAGKSLSFMGCASVSDANGNLLFYSDAKHVYNRSHTFMFNGYNVNVPVFVAANCMIVQKPGSSYIYYLFIANLPGAVYIPNFNPALHPFTVTEIDMRADGGKGAVIQSTKNSVLASGLAPKLTAAMHSNNRDVWIITHSIFGNNFQAFLCTPSGIASPVVSSIGTTYNMNGNDSGYSGTMKASPNSQMIADVMANQKIAQLLDFDRTTGVLSVPKNFSFTDYLWGVAFSPDNSKIYLNDTRNVYQYNLLPGNFQQILASKTQVNNNNNLGALDMQIGINGKIYILPQKTRPGGGAYNNPHLSVINCPNESGTACGFQDTTIYLSRQGGMLLPALNQTLFRNANILQLTASKPYICAGDSVKLSAFGAGADQFTWLPANGLGTASGPEATVKPTVTTTYTVIGHSQCDTDTAQVTVIVAPPAFANAGPDKVICTSGSVQFSVPAQAGFTYAWNSSSLLSDTTLANPTFTANNTTTIDQFYQLIVTIEGPGVSCGKRTDTVQVTVKPQVQVNAGAALSFCSGTTAQLNPQQFNSKYTYSWSPANGLSNPNSFAPTLKPTFLRNQIPFFTPLPLPLMVVLLPVRYG